MIKKISKYLKKNKRHMVSLTSKMIEIPTVNPPGENYEKMVSFLEKECRSLGFKTKRHLTPKIVLDDYGIKGGSKRINLVADWKSGASDKTLHIASHYDVVPATDKWTTDPFKAVIKGNRIYGRGSEDMKGNIASILFALKAIKALGLRPKISLQLSFSPDEEIGGMTGLGYLVKKNLVKADYAMSEGCCGESVSIGNKGVLWAEITVRGKAAHASLPHRGVNAFERMTELAGEFSKLKKKISRRKTRYNMKEDILKRPTFVMGGLLQGGVKVNVVPGVATFSIDRRLIPEEDPKTARREIEEVIKKFNNKYRDSRVTVKFSSKGVSSVSKKDHRFLKVVSDAVKTVIGKKAKFDVMSGATDIRYFMWKGVPSLGYSAKGGESWHGDNEFVYIDSLVDTAKVYALIIGNLT